MQRRRRELQAEYEKRWGGTLDKVLDERNQADKDFWELAKLLHPIRPSDMTKARLEAARVGQPLGGARKQVLRTIRERLERDKFHQMTKAEKFDYLFKKVHAE